MKAEEPCTPACGKQFVGEHHSEHCLHFDGGPENAVQSVPDESEPATSFADIAAKFPNHSWEVADDQHNDYRVVRVAPTVDDTLIIWVEKLRYDNSDAEQCSCCGGETFVVEITRCRGCEQEFYTRDQSLTASRLARVARADKKKGETK